MDKLIFKQKIIFLWILILLLPLITLQQAYSFPLEAVMNYAFPSNLVASPQGDVVAWVFNRQGKRNIWIAKGPQYKAYQLTSYSLDDGQELSHLAFNFKGTIIVYVRGGSANKAGEYIREYKRKEVTLLLPDALIAATCTINNIPLATYNTKHYPMPEIKFVQSFLK